MTEIQALESRVSELEATVKRLESALGKQSKPKSGIRSMIGTFANRPEFEEVIRLGREWRKAQGVDGEVEESGE